LPLQDLANIGEALGGLAVIASLIFLAFELRRTRAAFRDAQYKQEVQRVIDVGRQIADNADVWLRGNRDYTSLAPEERVVFSTILYSQMVDFSEEWMLHQRGVIDSELWQATNRNLRYYLSFPGAQQWWRSQPLGLPEGFTEWVNGELFREDSADEPAA
jgi:hypothetical protein